ncbi:MAG: hypothetical protein DRG69_07510, partial [Deltaproteobacteria bacterium]
SLNKRAGIYHWGSSNTKISNNTFEKDGIWLQGGELSYFNTHIIENNMVNGKPVYYYKNTSGIKVPEDAGEVILANCSDMTVENINASSGTVGLVIAYTRSSLISNNIADSNNMDGIYIVSSSDNTIENNNVLNNVAGICFEYSSNNKVYNNNVSMNNGAGIHFLWSSDTNIIYLNNFINNGINFYSLGCINFWNSTSKITYTYNGNLYSNYLGNYWDDYTGSDVNGDGIGDVPYSIDSNKDYYPLMERFEIYLPKTIYVDNDFTDDPANHRWNTIQEGINDANDGDTIIVRDGIYVENVNVNKSLTIRSENGSENCIVDAGGSGNAITLSADEITLEGLTATNSGWGDAGIEVTSNNNTITGNNASNNNYNGIILRSSSKNTISSNTASNNYHYGIHLWYLCNNNLITSNNISNNNAGIYLYKSSNNTITGNTFVNDGFFVSSSYQNTVEDNIVNGKPLVYLEDTSDIEVTDAGQVILVNCNNISVENLDLSDTYAGVELWATGDSRISNNNASNNNYNGIHLYDSSNNTIISNIVNSNDGTGIRLEGSSCNTVSNNTVNSNNIDGIWVFRGVCKSSGNNIITNNVVNSNGMTGIRLTSSNNNTITANTANSNNDYGINLLSSSSNNTIASNTATNNFFGIYLHSSSNNTISGNNASSNNDTGIYFYSFSNNNIVICNTASNNHRGIYPYKSNNNKIYLNNFINNTDNIDSYDSTNIWNSTSKITYTYNGTTFTNFMGNYWSDYEGNDTNGDGIGDTAYNINSDADSHPLIEPWENYFIMPAQILPSVVTVPLIYNGKLFVGCADNKVYALNVTDPAQIIWTSEQLNGNISKYLSVDDTGVYATATTRIF